MRALLGSSEQRVAVAAAHRLGSPAVADDVTSWYPGFRRDREYVLFAADGCPKSQTGHDVAPAGNGPCFDFHLGSRPVPDPMNPGYAHYAEGQLFVSIAAHHPIRVYDFTYLGGGGDCKLGASCRQIVAAFERTRRAATSS